METLTKSDLISRVLDENFTELDALRYYLGLLNSVAKKGKSYLDKARQQAVSIIFEIFQNYKVPMAKPNISNKLSKIIAKYQSAKKSLKKKNGNKIWNDLVKKLEIKFYNPRNPIAAAEISLNSNEFYEAPMEIRNNDDDVANISVQMEEMDLSVNEELEERTDPSWHPEENQNPPIQKPLPGAENFVKNAIKHPSVTQACFQTGTSPENFMILTCAMNHANFVVSDGNCTTTIRNHQTAHRPQIASEITEKTTKDLSDSYVFLQWDEKCLANVTQEASEKDHVERLAIVGTSEKGNRLLAIEKLLRGKGEKIAEALYRAAVKFSILQLLIGMVFDTTSSNTGIDKGAAIMFQDMIGRFLLFLACRHHVFELYLKTCFESLFGASVSPSLTKLKSVRHSWHMIDFRKFQTLKPQKTKKERAALICFYRSVIGSQVRDDYREAAELALMLLKSGDKFNFRSPQSDSNARWMSKILYSAKGFMFGSQLNLSTDMLQKLEKFLIFAVYVYLPAWYRCPFITEAALTDIEFAKSLRWYRTIDKTAFDEIFHKMQNHTWYLGSELAWTSLFSDNVPLTTKRAMATKLNSVTAEWETRGIKLQGDHSLFTKSDTAVDIDKLKLEDLIDGRSRAVMEYLNIQWQWKNENEYKLEKNFVSTIPCINDACERACQLAGKTNDQGPRSEDARQEFYLIVDDAQKIPHKTLTQLNAYYANKR